MVVVTGGDGAEVVAPAAGGCRNNVALLTPLEKGLFVTAGARDDGVVVLWGTNGDEYDDDDDNAASIPNGDLCPSLGGFGGGGDTEARGAMASPNLIVVVGVTRDALISAWTDASEAVVGDNVCAVAGFQDVTRTSCDKKRINEMKNNMFARLRVAVPMLLLLLGCCSRRRIR